MELPNIGPDDMALAKSGFETGRTALGMLKDLLGLIPSGEKKEAATRTLEEADRGIRLAEAQVAQALGYPLCRCTFPPTPMLAVGYWPRPSGRKEVVHECPRCRQNDGLPQPSGVGGRQWPWYRTAPKPAPGSGGA